MNRERGASSLILALLILILGSLLLQGVNQQQASYAARVTTQSLAIQRQALVQSGAGMGAGGSYGQAVTEMECRRYSPSGARVCLRRLSGDEVVMAAQDDGMTLWRLGNVIQGSIVFSPHGWSDFCPLKEVALCRIP
ncbi:Protein of uncharacterised function (DUF2509) [Salmonella enterica subsp. enterica]|uniref:Protein of uncharacterized function (DUF2509) n=1 Tax=Salmonella enterica I TaxID=59201 RepID=A0A379WMC7_SALET|nr:Protein of uncharacterised function (DUF2509) [Salmonella enterica subsp. enterica]